MADHEFYAYVGAKPCGCKVAATVDDPKWAKETAKSVASMIKHGLSVERVFVPAGETLGVRKCVHKVEEQQSELFVAKA